MADGQDKDDRTEEPTQKRLNDAAEKGDVAKSQEITTFMALGAMTLAMMLAAGWSARSLTLDLRGFLAHPHLVPDGAAGMLGAGRRALLAGLSALALPVGLVLAGAVAGSLIQHRPVLSAQSLKPQLSRLSPAAGLKRVLGGQAVGNFVKGLLKIVVVGAIASYVLWGEQSRLGSLIGMSPAAVLTACLSVALKMLGVILAVYAVLAIGDYVFARFSWMRRQRMTKHELKEEMKEQDGNPEIKAKLRQIRMARVKKRMMAAVPKATVVVTNPTHYAVALRYEKGQAAPVCVAKGVDALALRIRTVATEHGVPIVENPPLARALHATVEIDDEIPVEHYKAVAEVIGYVLRLRRRAS